ncbi:UDP-galactopyranose mutase [Psychromarinibacter sp. C21-152]|uniref:UDP-galactopyranose mutase n=1 Tax=Psychromarinibacter sediminicola TaxID=3033385 RepID=A0AAE3TB81_9RHOB|nr:UDP-galactopyranose mutase [Psychromarinibacter sediminicola]MDF0603563.1 UDP-galactopyranose mutase [Psychromarinibacter sediminicola]
MASGTTLSASAELKPVLIVGAGFAGAVLARSLADAGLPSTVIDARSHVAGNCHTERDPVTDVLTHVYGPHIFHTDAAEVWAYVTRFADFMPYEHRVRTTVGTRVYSLPIDLLTINQFYGTAMRPDEARAFIAAEADPIPAPANFEEQARSTVGVRLYEAFFKGYTQKQWGRSPKELPASVFNRLPLRFRYDGRYFSHRFQGIPREGYSRLVERILEHPLIDLRLRTSFAREAATGHGHVFWSGPLDEYFDFRLGRLPYRTLDFEHFRAEGDYQGCPVMNYADPDVPYTRITEHKHFAYWEDHPQTICTQEHSRAAGPTDIPYYPVRLANEKALLRDYLSLAGTVDGVTFIGRLGTYRYIDMDQCIAEALTTASTYLDALKAERSMPAFVQSPL